MALKARQQMQSCVDHWYKTLEDWLPRGALEEPVEHHIPTESSPGIGYTLRFPSDFSPESRSRLGLTSAAVVERDLRIGQAFDALKRLRDWLGLKSFMVRDKRQNDRGVRANLKGEINIARVQKQCLRWKQVYCRNWEALARLKVGFQDDDGTGWPQDACHLRKLEDKDLTMLSSWLEEHRSRRTAGEVLQAQHEARGEPRVDLPWIWKMDMESESFGAVTRNEVEQWTEEGKLHRPACFMCFH